LIYQNVNAPDDASWGRFSRLIQINNTRKRQLYKNNIGSIFPPPGDPTLRSPGLPRPGLYVSGASLLAAARLAANQAATFLIDLGNIHAFDFKKERVGIEMGGTLKTKMGLVALVAGGLLSPLDAANASQAGTANADRAFGMSIGVGRLETMVTKAEEIADVFAQTGAHRSAPSIAGNTTFQELKIVVLRYNLLVASACGPNRAHPEFCRELYLPAWLADPAESMRNQAKLQTMIRDASAKIAPFWTGICTKGKPVPTDERFCELE
jgi:hypothetical protein